jgi:CheY-like chemotaxis protein
MAESPRVSPKRDRNANLMPMLRPCFLVIDREFPGSISTRKLVIETAKFNVVTAYSAIEAIETLRAFPNIHGVVLDADIYGVRCSDLVRELKALKPGIPIVAISGPGDDACPGADQQLESFDPKELLSVLRTLQPEQVKSIEKREEDLNRIDH